MYIHVYISIWKDICYFGYQTTATGNRLQCFPQPKKKKKQNRYFMIFVAI